MSRSLVLVEIEYDGFDIDPVNDIDWSERLGLSTLVIEAISSSDLDEKELRQTGVNLLKSAKN